MYMQTCAVLCKKSYLGLSEKKIGFILCQVSLDEVIIANFLILNNTHNTVLRLGQDEALQIIDHARAHKVLLNNARYKDKVEA